MSAQSVKSARIIRCLILPALLALGATPLSAQDDAARTAETEKLMLLSRRAESSMDGPYSWIPWARPRSHPATLPPAAKPSDPIP